MAKKKSSKKKGKKKEGITVKASSSWRDAHENEEDVKESKESPAKGNDDNDDDKERDELNKAGVPVTRRDPKSKKWRYKPENKEEVEAARKHQENESVNTARFLGALTQKNYAEANKYLRAVVDTKLVKVIKQSQQEN